MRIARFAVPVLLALAPALHAADLDEIKKRGTIRFVAAADEDPRMFAHQGGANPGFERELAEGFAALHKLKSPTPRRPTTTASPLSSAATAT